MAGSHLEPLLQSQRRLSKGRNSKLELQAVGGIPWLCLVAQDPEQSGLLPCALLQTLAGHQGLPWALPPGRKGSSPGSEPDLCSHLLMAVRRFPGTLRSRAPGFALLEAQPWQQWHFSVTSPTPAPPQRQVPLLSLQQQPLAPVPALRQGCRLPLPPMPASLTPAEPGLGALLPTQRVQLPVEQPGTCLLYLFWL